jgi:hypothetical protein
MDITLSQFDTAVDSQAKAFLVAVREAAPLMPNGGRIVAITFAPGGRFGSWQLWVAMGARKQRLKQRTHPEILPCIQVPRNQARPWEALPTVIFAGSFVSEGLDRIAMRSANCRISSTRQRANNSDQNGTEDPSRSDFDL